MVNDHKICKNPDVFQNLQLIADKNNLSYSTVFRHALTAYVKQYFRHHMPEQLTDEVIIYKSLRDSSKPGAPPLEFNVSESRRKTDQQDRIRKLVPPIAVCLDNRTAHQLFDKYRNKN